VNGGFQTLTKNNTGKHCRSVVQCNPHQFFYLGKYWINRLYMRSVALDGARKSPMLRRYAPFSALHPPCVSSCSPNYFSVSLVLELAEIRQIPGVGIKKSTPR